ncbi:hypothetical protein [Paenibacillus sp. Soil750]|uniref:hypothetical protein n=1 Tax=Paenibacillus sp. Soil750 TaxID=1736398 RepID=UPI0006F7286A|nr:hypothetical protein [Paenibacillus sp. Soil750]KRE67855.1 hypothetical protein ASL11_18475 [Paenibacillus sp. Soil750]
MPQGRQGQTKPVSPSHQQSQQSLSAPTSTSATQMSPMGTNVFMQMQRTVGNRATQAYANQLIQRNNSGQAATVAPPPVTFHRARATGLAPAPASTVAPTTQVAPQSAAPAPPVTFHRGRATGGAPAPASQVAPPTLTRTAGTVAPPGAATVAPTSQVAPPTLTRTAGTVAPPGTATVAPASQVAPPTLTRTAGTVAPPGAATVAPASQVAPPTLTRTAGTAAPTVVASASTMHPTGDDTKDNADMTAGVGGAFSDSFGKRSDDLKDSYDKTKDAGTAQQSATMGAVASTADLVSGPFQIMSAIRETITASRERQGHDKRFQYAGTGSTMIEAGGKMVSGSAGLVDKAAKSTGKEDGVGASSSVSDYSGTVAEAISAVKNTIMAVKAIYDMYKKSVDNGGLDKGEKARGVIEIISNAIQAAQSGIKVAKGIMDIMETSTASLTSVIPGVSIAVSGVKIAIKTVDVIKAGLNRSAMTTMKRDFKGKAGNADILKEKRWYTRNAGVDKAKLATKKAQLNADIASGDPAKVAAANQQLDEIAQYELAKEMKNINVKRTDRGAIQIGLELTKIAADIATLTGVGAQVGMPLKIVASGIGAAMPIARSLKQAGRDRASKAGAWGITKAVFNADKSTEKKLEKRAHDTDLIFDMFDKLPTFDQQDAACVTRYKQVESFVEAAGISIQALNEFKSNPAKLKGAIVEAMGKRE